jgi:uncharacterized protein
MKAVKYVLVASILCAGAAAFAQPQTQIQTQAPASVPAVVTPEQKAAVKDLLEAMNFKKMMSQMAGAMAQNMPQMMDQMVAASDTSMTAEQKAEARKLAGKSSETVMKSMIDIYNDPQVVQGMEDIMARAYGSNFAVDEIKAITTFYSSPAGKKMLATQPQIMQQSMPEIMALITPRMKEVMGKMAKDIAEQAKEQSKISAAPAKK